MPNKYGGRYNKTNSGTHKMLLPQRRYYYHVTKAYEMKMSPSPLQKQTQNLRRLLKTKSWSSSINITS